MKTVRAGGDGAVGADELLEVEAVEELHDVVEGAVAGDAEVEELDGVLGLEGGDGAGLALEALDGDLALVGGAAGGDVGADELDGGRALEHAMAGAPDLAHAALAEPGLELVGAELAGAGDLAAELVEGDRDPPGEKGHNVRDDGHGVRGAALRDRSEPDGVAAEHGDGDHGGRGEGDDEAAEGGGGDEEPEHEDPDRHEADDAAGYAEVVEGDRLGDGDESGEQDLVCETEVCRELGVEGGSAEGEGEAEGDGDAEQPRRDGDRGQRDALDHEVEGEVAGDREREQAGDHQGQGLEAREGPGDDVGRERTRAPAGGLARGGSGDVEEGARGGALGHGGLTVTGSGGR